MKEIKRYNTFIKKTKWQGNFSDTREAKQGVLVKYLDHKSVVETMQKRIDKLEADRLEMANAVMVRDSEMIEETGCNLCGWRDHDDCDNCIVLKAERIIKDN